MTTSRSNAVSSTAIMRGALIDETYTILRGWDFGESRTENLRRVRDDNPIGATSSRWATKVTDAFSRVFDPAGRDRPLAEIAVAGCDREIWKSILLYHMTRDEFLLRDFLVNWLYPHYRRGTYRLYVDEVTSYLKSLNTQRGIVFSRTWSESTTVRVAQGLLRIAADFGLLRGTMYKEFASYHLPEESFIYLLHAMADSEPNARRIVESEDWHMYLLDGSDVERELLRLHQFRKIRYEVAGSLAQLKLPHESSVQHARAFAA
ncbi:MAG: DUF1819 family protein [Chloroflexota bacterium]|nr:DUF1819 family protein [Chloroflexota bacterium]